MNMSDASYWKNNWLDRQIGPASNFARRAYLMIKNKKLKSLLDLGCGNGRDSMYFSKKGLEVTAIDISESGIKALKARSQNTRCVQKDIRKINFPKNSFDVIYANLSLHYFDNKTLDEIFDNLYKILRKEGLIFVKCKSVKDSHFGKGKKIEENVYKEGHVRHFFTKEYMIEKLKKFNVLKVRKTRKEKFAFIEAVAIKKW